MRFPRAGSAQRNPDSVRRAGFTGEGLEPPSTYEATIRLGLTDPRIHALVLGYWHTIVTPPMVFARLMAEVVEEMTEGSRPPRRTEASRATRLEHHGRPESPSGPLSASPALAQGVLVMEGSPAADAERLSDLKDDRLGAQVGTTALDFVNTVDWTPRGLEGEHSPPVAGEKLGVEAVLGDYGGGPWDNRADVWMILARK